VEIFIREVRESDYLALLPLWRDFGGFANEENIVRHYGRIKDDQRYKTFVADCGGETVGCITTVQYYGIGIEGSYMVIIGISVKEDMQGRGIGTKLIEHNEEYAKESGVFSIYLNSDMKRTDAHGFYERNGYGRHSFGFGKTINPINR